jgi:hypothetical protein
MAWMDVLNHYRNAPQLPPTVEDDFDAVAREVPRHDLSDGLEEAFRSEQTPPFEQMVRQLYENSDDDQRAGVLNNFLEEMGPDTALTLAGGSVADLLRRAARERSAISPRDARNVPPQDVEAVAARAARDNPHVMQRISRFYAQHPQVVRMLGQAALGIAMNRMAMRRR